MKKEKCENKASPKQMPYLQSSNCKGAKKLAKHASMHGHKFLKLGPRENVVMTRLSNGDQEKIDALVEIEAFKSRSEAAAFFIREGIEARKDIVEKVMPTVEKIKELRLQARESLRMTERSKNEKTKKKL